MEGVPQGLLRSFALALPDVVEGVACRGTPLEKRNFKVGGKAFLFLGSKEGGFDVMLKLGESLPAATKLAGKEPGRYKVGAHGWVTAAFRKDEAPPPDRLEAWIGESYRVNAGKKLEAARADRGTPGAEKNEKTASRTSAKSKSSKR
jgi:hypothetical protein